MGSDLRIRRPYFLFLVLSLLYSTDAFSLTKEESDDIRKEAANFKYNTVTTKEGLNFRVPEDMPVEMRNGIQAPIPFDEYMYGKFKQMDSRLKSIESKLDEIQKALISTNDKSKVPADKDSGVASNRNILKG